MPYATSAGPASNAAACVISTTTAPAINHFCGRSMRNNRRRTLPASSRESVSSGTDSLQKPLMRLRPPALHRPCGDVGSNRAVGSAPGPLRHDLRLDGFVAVRTLLVGDGGARQHLAVLGARLEQAVVRAVRDDASTVDEHHPVGE